MNSAVRRLPSALLGLALLGVAPPVPAADVWTHYRGNSHDGVYAGAIRTNWSEAAPRRLWRIPLGAGLSSFSVGGGRLFTQVVRRTGNESREFAIALDAATGKELWAANLDLADYPDGGVGSDDGPRSTPTVDGDRVYVFSSYLRLHCLEAATGRVLWQRDFRTELGATVISWQNAASPLVIGDLIFVNANTSPRRLTAIRKTDGTTAWRNHDDRMTQATPTAATIGGVLQVIFFTQTGLVSVRPDTGDALWRFSLPYSTSTAASPVVAGDTVFCGAAYGSGSGAVRIHAPTPGAAGSFTTTELWKRRAANQLHWASPIQHDGFVYGVFGQSSLSLRCVEIATGNVRWQALDNFNDPNFIDYGSVLKVGGHLLVLTASGKIILAELSPEAYRPIEIFQALDNDPKCWNVPAINDGILYVRSTLEGTAFDLSMPQPAQPLVLNPGSVSSAGKIQLRVGTADGSPVSAERAANLRLITSPNLTVPTAAWTDSNLSPLQANGDLYFEPVVNTDEEFRFYRIRENP
ncbi:MAG: PQQ-like beta-propeller repeat protein [Verrucomicrobiales bacterium]|nr:PQQ-like beta-propeller repeat protein [Verrucomicrobiales bacterium]